MKPGDVVLYSVQDKTYNALVLHVHTGQPELLGKNGEPLLHLAFLAPDRESAIERKKFGYIPQVFTEYDVVHHSQEFSDEYKQKNGIASPAQLAAARGQGEWKALTEHIDAHIAATLAAQNADAPVDVFDIPQVPDPNPTQE
jgi:hypothetical protein